MQGKLLIAHVPSSNQPTNLLTKAVSKFKFSSLTDKVRVKDLQQISKGQPQLELRGHDKVG